jgi:hypothetical protein
MDKTKHENLLNPTPFGMKYPTTQWHWFMGNTRHFDDNAMIK